MNIENWQLGFDDRQQKEIEFSRLYEKDFHHGTDGHNSKMIIAKMARILSLYEDRIRELGGNASPVDAL